ncbi:MFS transporter [Pseudomonas sp. NPDC087690]|uniref:MFS transporter n=1 Tax=Pseudomonas sp. NPDC087690 TaxID=3364446 RepID=UPI003805D3BA
MLGETVRKAGNDATEAASQWALISLCMLFNVIDGLDVMAMAFTASRVAAEWGLKGAELGTLLSASLLGMAVGSLLAGPRADLYGRRPVLLTGLALSSLSMLLCFWSPNPYVLIGLRLLTGVGTGAILVGANVLTYEHTSAHRRNLAIALQSVAFALGASLGGLLAHVLNEYAGWRYVFLTGGLLTLAGALAGACWLRESPAFMALDPQSPRTAPMTVTLRSAQYRELFAAGQWQQTLALALALLLIMFCFYFVMSWTPTLMIHSGFSEKQGVAVGMLLCAGGVIGALSLGLAANRFGCRRLLRGALLLNVALMLLIVPSSHVAGLIVPVGIATGLLLNGMIAAMFILTPQAFDTAIRTRGVGLVLATGRIGAILSPVIAGLLLDANWSTQGLFAFFAGSQVLAALLIGFGCGRAGRQTSKPC